MRLVNLFLTEDGVLKLGYYGLMTQAECYSIKGKDCDGIRSFAPEVFKGKFKMKSDVWSFGTALIEMMGMVPYVVYCNSRWPIKNPNSEIPFDKRDIKSKEVIDFLYKCFAYRVVKTLGVYELLNVSVMGWRVMSRIHL